MRVLIYFWRYASMGFAVVGTCVGAIALLFFRFDLQHRAWPQMDHHFAAEKINASCTGVDMAAGFLSIRDFLSTLPPYEVLRLLYDETYAEPGVSQGVRDFVGQGFASKRKLLEFVYGADSRLTDYSEWQNLRKPTP